MYIQFQLAEQDDKQPVEKIEDILPLSEKNKRKLFQEAMNEAEKKSLLLKSKIISQLSEACKNIRHF